MISSFQRHSVSIPAIKTLFWAFIIPMRPSMASTQVRGGPTMTKGQKEEAASHRLFSSLENFVQHIPEKNLLFYWGRVLLLSSLYKNRVRTLTMVEMKFLVSKGTLQIWEWGKGEDKVQPQNFPNKVAIVVIYSFAQQIFTEYLLWARHCCRCWGYSNKQTDQESE